MDDNFLHTKTKVFIYFSALNYREVQIQTQRH